MELSRGFIVDQAGILQYANNEIDTKWIQYVLDELTVRIVPIGL